MEKIFYVTKRQRNWMRLVKDQILFLPFLRDPDLSSQDDFPKNDFVSAMMKVFPFAFFNLESWCALWFQKYSSLQSNGVDDVGVNKFTVAACQLVGISSLMLLVWNIFPYLLHSELNISRRTHRAVWACHPSWIEYPNWA